jgi:hypothetical protein
LTNLRSLTKPQNQTAPALPIAKLEVQRTPRRAASVLDEGDVATAEPEEKPAAVVSPRSSKKQDSNDPSQHVKSAEKQIEAETHQWEEYERIIATGDESSRTSKWDDQLSKLKKRREKLAKEAKEEEKRQAAAANASKKKGKTKEKPSSVNSSPTTSRAEAPSAIPTHVKDGLKRKISFQVAPVIKIEDAENPRVKKFTEPENDSNIRYMPGTGTADGSPKILGATVEKLVQKLTPDVQPGTFLRVDFILLGNTVLTHHPRLIFRPELLGMLPVNVPQLHDPEGAPRLVTTPLEYAASRFDKES